MEGIFSKLVHGARRVAPWLRELGDGLELNGSFGRTGWVIKRSSEEVSEVLPPLQRSQTTGTTPEQDRWTISGPAGLKGILFLAA